MPKRKRGARRVYGKKGARSKGQKHLKTYLQKKTSSVADVSTFIFVSNEVMLSFIFESESVQDGNLVNFSPFLSMYFCDF